jgi:hypothetical protein
MSPTLTRRQIFRRETLYVINVGSFIAISDPNDQNDGRMAIDFFDGTWKWLSGLGWRAGPDPS